MLYEGETLQEAFAKALGKPGSKYGKKPVYKKPGGYGGYRVKPTSYGKQGEENPNASTAAIWRARQDAIAWARNYMANQRTYGAGNEFGCYATYNINDGTWEKYPRNVAGRGGRAHYRFNYTRSQGLLLVTGHSHPRESEADSRSPSGSNNDQNTVLTEAALNDDDSELLRWAPVIIKVPTDRLTRPSLFMGRWYGR